MSRPDRAIAPGAVSQKLIEKRDLEVSVVAPVAQKISHWKWPLLRSCSGWGFCDTLRFAKIFTVGLTGTRYRASFRFFVCYTVTVFGLVPIRSFDSTLISGDPVSQLYVFEGAVRRKGRVWIVGFTLV